MAPPPGKIGLTGAGMHHTSFKSSVYLVKLLISQLEPLLVDPQDLKTLNGSAN